MNWGIVLAIGIATLPFFMLPSILAFRNRKRQAVLILAFNVLVTAVLPFGAGALLAVFFGFESPYIGTLPLLVVIAAWLALSAYSLRGDAATAQDIDEPVRLVEYDATWPEAFEDERRRILDALAVSVERVEHIGSTAVPGMPAKPVVDMMLGVDRLPPAHDLLARLRILGYQDLGEAGIPGRVYLRLRGELRDFNLHVVQRGGELWRNNLAFRELLRADPEARERYSRGKVGALHSGGGRLLAYSDAKNPLVAELLATARAR